MSAHPPHATPGQWPATTPAEPSAPAPTTLVRVERKYDSIRRALWVEAGVLVTLSLGLVALELVGGIAIGGIGAVLATVLALAPVPALIALGLWLDRFEPEPVWLLARTFLWGAAVAIVVAAIINTTVGAVAGQFAAAVGSAPIVEEFMKGLAVLFVFRHRSEHLNGVTDGIVYALFVGLGFAVVENVQYYTMGFEQQGAAGLAGTVVIRGVVTPFLHPFFTMFIGIGLGMAISRRGAVRVLLPLGGYLVAVFLHALWNSGLGVLLFPVLFVPGFITVVVLLVVERNRQRRMLQQHLWPEVGTGLIGADQYQRLHAVGTSLRMFLRALRRSDDPLHAWRRFHHAAFALAAHRDRIWQRLAQDTPPNDGDRALEHVLREHVWAARHALPAAIDA